MIIYYAHRISALISHHQRSLLWKMIRTDTDISKRFAILPQRHLLKYIHSDLIHNSQSLEVI